MPKHRSPIDQPRSGKCEHQPPIPADDGCGTELKHWLALIKPKPKPAVPPPPGKPQPVKPAITLDQLPAECRTVLTSGKDAPVLAATPAKPTAPAPAAPKAPDAK